MPDKINHLANETSPFLKRNAKNLVEWYPWCEEAFKRAEKENKPVFVSIGYSACYWTYVMEQESFNDPDIAGMLNEAFINIKIDKEERPDLDAIYGKQCQILTSGSGWPMNLFLTPEKIAFWGGTYFPKETREKRAGMMEILPKIALGWMEQKDDIILSSKLILKKIEFMISKKKDKSLENNIFAECFKGLSNVFDPKFPGFGIEPKFLVPHHYQFLLRHWKRTGEEDALDMVEKALKAMIDGGVNDHISGGFHRYSRDRDWQIPHFEKILSDQALMLSLLIEAYKATQKDVYKDQAIKLADFVLRDMSNNSGAFYSSVSAHYNGIEGKYYTWSLEEIKNALSSDLDIFIDVFEIKEEGNYIDQHEQLAKAENILKKKDDLSDILEKYDIDENTLNKKLEQCFKELKQLRDKKDPIFVDKKVLADWNSLMIASLAKAGKVLCNQTYIDAAEKAFTFISGKMYDKALYHNYASGKCSVDGMLDDYVCFQNAMLYLYFATYKIQYLEDAILLTEKISCLFEDKKEHGFFQTSKADLVARNKDVFDGAVPSANSMHLWNLAMIGKITGNFNYEISSQKLMDMFAKSVSESPSLYTRFMCGADLLMNPTKEIIIAGERTDQTVQAMLEVCNQTFTPDSIVIIKDEANAEKLEKMADYLKDFSKKNGKTTAYVCENYDCFQPVYTAEDLKTQI